MNTCATCKHWRKMPDPEADPDAWEAYEWSRMGYEPDKGACVKAIDGNEMMEISAYDDCGLCMITRAEFGCVLHEGK